MIISIDFIRLDVQEWLIKSIMVARREVNKECQSLREVREDKMSSVFQLPLEISNVMAGHQTLHIKLNIYLDISCTGLFQAKDTHLEADEQSGAS